MKELPGSPGCFGVAGVQGVLYVSTQVPEEQAGARSCIILQAIISFWTLLMMGSQCRHLGRKVMGSDIHIKGITQTSVSSIY